MTQKMLQIETKNNILCCIYDTYKVWYTIYGMLRKSNTICSHTIYGMLRKSNTIYSYTIYGIAKMIHTRQVKVGAGNLKIAKASYPATQLPTLIEKMSYLL